MTRMFAVGYYYTARQFISGSTDSLETAFATVCKDYTKSHATTLTDKECAMLKGRVFAEYRNKTEAIACYREHIAENAPDMLSYSA